MSTAILPHTLAVFAVDSTLVDCYDLRPIHDAKEYYVQVKWNVPKSGHQYHTQSCTVYIYHVLIAK